MTNAVTIKLLRNHPWTPSNDQEYHNWRNSTSTSQYQCDWIAAGGGEGSPLTVIMGHYGTPTPALEATIFININIIGNIKINIDKNINIIFITGHFRKPAPEHLHCHIYLSIRSINCLCLPGYDRSAGYRSRDFGKTTITIIPIFLWGVFARLPLKKKAGGCKWAPLVVYLDPH